jgi:hypothetical protein
MTSAFVSASSLRVTAFAPASASTRAISPRVRRAPLTMLLGGFFNRRLRSARSNGPGKNRGGLGGSGGSGRGKDAGGSGGGAGREVRKFLSNVPGFGGGNPVAHLLAGYRHQLSRHPLPVQMVTSFVGFAVSTLIVEAGGSRRDVDWRHAATNGFLGAIVHGLAGHFYYPAAERLLPGAGITALAGKTALEFVGWLPWVTVGHRALHRASRNGAGLKDAWAKIKDDGWHTPAPIWIAWSLVMFNSVPAPAERVLAYNVIVAATAIAQRALGDSDVGSTEPVRK